ncbi:hypothetical protein FQR65_LT03535 [Abscondita terminalis]|nr:hypothetical protein FQR65_LT03535 [Abscondita terminalis]
MHKIFLVFWFGVGAGAVPSRNVDHEAFQKLINHIQSHYETRYNIITIMGDVNVRLRDVADWILRDYRTMPTLVVDVVAEERTKSTVASNLIITLLENASEIERVQKTLTNYTFFSYDAYVFFFIFGEVAEGDWTMRVGKNLWKLKILNFFFVYVTTKLEIVTYNPFVTSKLINYADDGRHLGGVLEEIPRSVIKQDKIYSTDYDFMLRILKHLNASVEVVKFLYGKRSYNMLSTSIFRGDVDFGMMTYFLFNSSFSGVANVERYAYPHRIDAVVILLPKPELIPTYMNIFLVFNYVVWIAFTLAFVGITLMMEAVDVVSRRNEILTGDASFLQIVRIVSNVPTIERQKRVLSKRFVFGCCLWLTFFFHVSFNCNLTSTLVKPKEFNMITTISELVKSKRKIYIEKAFAAYSTSYNTMQNQYLYANTNFISEMIMSGETRYGYGCTSLEAARIFMTEVEQKFNKNLFYVLKEHLVPGHRAYVFPKNSPYVSTINEMMLKFYETGLYKIKHKNKKLLANHTNKTPLTLSHMQTPFYLLILGLIVSALVFAGEIVYFNRSK